MDKLQRAISNANGRKPLIITNGMARSGKDTFSGFVSKYVSVYKYSSIDKVKEIARQCGWNGEKDEKSRSFLSELKMLTSKYFDMSFKDVEEKYRVFQEDDRYDVMIVDIREPKEIERAKQELGAITVLIENNRVKQLTSNYGDAHVRDYQYDYTIYNNGTLNEFDFETEIFCACTLEPLIKAAKEIER